MKIIEAPDVYRSLPIVKPKAIFLAGSIEMGSAEEWQQEVIDALSLSKMNKKRTIVLNPRRKDWNLKWEQSIKNTNFKEQVEWELCGIKDADLVIFYFDPKTQSPITLMELGTMSNSEKSCIVCCPDGYWRKGNVEVYCEWAGIQLHHTKEDLLEDLKTLKWK
jgi:Nucleoside 2-deoxyribosyltransferase like